MPTKWLMFMISAFVLGCLLGGFIEKVQWAGQDMTLIQALMSPTPISLLNMSYWNLWVKVATFDYVFLTEHWWGQIIRYFFLAMGIGLIVTLVWNVIGMIRGTSVTSN